MSPVAGLDGRALRRAWSFLDDIRGADSPQTLQELLLPALVRLVGADAIGFNVLRFDGSLPEVTIYPEQPSQPYLEAFGALMDEHPSVRLGRRTGSMSPHLLTELCPPARLQRLAVYQEVLRPTHVEYQLNTGLELGPQTVIGLCAARHGRDFGPRELDLLTAVNPHLVESYHAAAGRHAVSMQQQLLDRCAEIGFDRGSPVACLVDRAGRLVAASARARGLLGHLGMAPGSTRLPDAVARWLAHRRTAGPLAGGGDFLADVPAGRLRVRTVPGGSGADERTDVLLLHLEPAAVGWAGSPGEGAAPGLSARERAVVELVAQGLTNAAVGRRLGISGRTVDKHLQHVYDRLGVRGRAAAAALVAAGRAGL